MPETPVTGEVLIRRATAADIPAIVAIYNEAVATTTASWDYDPQPLADRAAWFAEREASGHAVLVAEADGRVLGWGSWGPYRAKHGYRLTMEHSVYVDAAARGRGVGRLLLAGLIDTAREAGVHVLVGAVTDDNEVSFALHEAFGFVEVGRMPQVGVKFGRWLTLVLLQLTLDDAPPPE
ncbi:MAG: GNAT family N-acetyltransferase [Propioniciclava sp.]|uniref:GNAT family N-acetyltransferase n=1 Tax=Propioniciclava sp. TaxID=2038686 RepID=UPI0039E35315